MTTLRLWVDDIRQPTGTPEEKASWTVARTSSEAIHLIQKNDLELGRFEAIALDHDLGMVDGETDDTRPVINWIVNASRWPEHVYFLTSNPVGYRHLLGTVQSNAPDWVEVHEK